MELRDEKIINASRERVWEALNDPEVLRQCIPGCKSLTKVDDTHLDAVASLKVGPVKATFDGHVELTELNPPESYAIVGEGKGGVAGFAKGRADVHLIEEGPEQTRLAYEAKAEVGGKLAQLGSRLIDSTAKKLSNEFFTKFKEVVEGPPAEVAETEAVAAAAGAEPAAETPPPSREPAEAAVTAPAAGAMQSAEGREKAETASGGADEAAAQRFREEVAKRPETGKAEGGGLPWRWIAAIIGGLVILALLAGVI